MRGSWGDGRAAARLIVQLRRENEDRRRRASQRDMVNTAALRASQEQRAAVPDLRATSGQRGRFHLTPPPQKRSRMQQRKHRLEMQTQLRARIKDHEARPRFSREVGSLAERAKRCMNTKCCKNRWGRALERLNAHASFCLGDAGHR